MFGPQILVRSLSRATRTDRDGNTWQYHSRSDHHSKVACWGIIFDLLNASPLLRQHAGEGRIGFGINHEMRDFVHDRKKNLDVVICTPSAESAQASVSLADLAKRYAIDLSDEEAAAFVRLPALRQIPVGSVLMALEAKAAMTAHQRALPRLYDELNSSQATVHGSTDQAIAAGFVMVNMAQDYLSPDLNKRRGASNPEWSHHRQPRDAQLVVDKVRQLPRRAKPGDVGFDALAIVVIDMRNDGSPVTLVTGPPAPPSGDIYSYVSMIDRTAHVYATRFQHL